MAPTLAPRPSPVCDGSCRERAGRRPAPRSDPAAGPKEPNRRGRLVGPLVEYGHAEGGCSVTGGFVYRGERIPAAVGRYFHGDFCSGAVWSVHERDGRAGRPRRHGFEVPALSSFGEGAAGELYLVSLEGRGFRLDPR